MKFYDLRHPLTGTVYRLGLRVLTLPGIEERRERVLVPLCETPSGRVPLVTHAEGIIVALPDRIDRPGVGVTRATLIDRGWTPAD